MKNEYTASTKDHAPLLEEKLAEYTSLLREQGQLLEDLREALRVSEKRCEAAMQLAAVTMFEYNIVTKQLTLFEKDASMYGVTAVIENGMETFLQKGIVSAESTAAYREMYHKIHAGEPFAKCNVTSRDTMGTLHDFELSLTTIYNPLGKPIRAIGVRKNITQIRQLERETAFGKTMVSGKTFFCEADVTENRLLNIAPIWSDQVVTTEMPLTEVMANICEKTVSPEYREMILQNLSPRHIAAVYDKGERLFSFQYQKHNEQGEYGWYEATVTIIIDNATGHLIIRYYSADIDERKKKEQRALEEQRLYETMVSQATLIYEINLTRNQFISGHENWGRMFGIYGSGSYSELIQLVLEKAIYPDDAEAFRAATLRENLLAQFQEGNTLLSCCYRRPNDMGKFAWVKCTFHLYEHPGTGDIRSYTYIEDIDEQKKAELALLYKAEHDSLTGFYNKAMTEKLITDFLSTSDAKVRKHAFIMIDIDRFKSINDNFGHVFGDAVLSQTSAKIATLFRGDDILGRVGGDEFVVFMKNVCNAKAAAAKAEEIRALLEESYSQRGKSYNVSASIGVALFPKHGKSYVDLYIHSDSALYASKKNGRNRCSLYSSVMELVESGEKEFSPLGLLEIHTFEDNISEYIFRILYESKDKDSSINAMLSLMGKHLNVSRAYIFEESADGLFISNTYEWCNTGIAPYKGELQELSYESLDDYKRNFNEDGIFFMPNIALATPGVKATLEPQGVKSMLQFAITREGRMVGFIGFDQCDYIRLPSSKEVSDCRNVAQILEIFMEMRYLKQYKKNSEEQV